MQINKWGCVPIKPCTERWQAGFLGPVICWFLLFMAKVWFNMAIHHYIYILKNLTKQGVSSLQSIDIFGFGSDMKNSWVHIKSQIFIFLWKKKKKTEELKTLSLNELGLNILFSFPQRDWVLSRCSHSLFAHSSHGLAWLLPVPHSEHWNWDPSELQNLN